MSATKHAVTTAHDVVKDLTVARKSATVDTMSKKGVFGWDIIGGINIPYILREKEAFLAVKMVENRVLCHYPSTYPEELTKRPPLASEFITPAEASLLNEINRDHCDHEFGYELFTTADIIVRVSEFKTFFEIVQKNFGGLLNQDVGSKGCLPPDNITGGWLQGSKGCLTPDNITGGWLQVNNTVIPYVNKQATKFIPLSVVKFAAGLLRKSEVDGMDLTKEECVFLTEMCSEASLTFDFSPPTKALPINLVCQLNKDVVHVKELPRHDPFSYAEHTDEIGADQIVKSPEVVSKSLAVTHTAVHPNLPTNGHVSLPTRSLSSMHPMTNSLQGACFPPPSRAANTAFAQHYNRRAAGQPRGPIHRNTLTADVVKRLQAVKSATPPARIRLPQPLEGMQALQDRFLPSPFTENTALNMHSLQQHNAAQQMATKSSRKPPPSARGSFSMYRPDVAQQMFPPQMPRPVQVQIPTPVQRHAQEMEQEQDRSHVEESTKIKAIEICGKTVSCLISKTGQYALIEAVCKVFFPEANLQEFQYAIESVLQVPIHRLSRQEEHAFLTFYELPTNSLSCQSAINIKHFPYIMCRLRRMFDGNALPQSHNIQAMKRPMADQALPSKSRKLEDTVQKLVNRASHSS